MPLNKPGLLKREQRSKCSNKKEEYSTSINKAETSKHLLVQARAMVDQATSSSTHSSFLDGLLIRALELALGSAWLT